MLCLGAMRLQRPAVQQRGSQTDNLDLTMAVSSMRLLRCNVLLLQATAQFSHWEEQQGSQSLA